VKRLMAGILVMSLMFMHITLEASAVVPTGSITDIGGHWAQADIEKACTQGLMGGVSEDAQGAGIFRPDKDLSRAELALIMVRIFALDIDKTKYVRHPTASDYYLDVNESDWYARAVILCAVNEVFPFEQQFRPGESASRLEVAQAIYKCCVLRKVPLPAVTNSASFEDAGVLSPDQIQALEFLSVKGIMNGYENHFRPQDSLSRAEMAVIINRSVSVLEEDGKIWLSGILMSMGA